MTTKDYQKTRLCLAWVLTALLAYPCILSEAEGLDSCLEPANVHIDLEGQTDVALGEAIDLRVRYVNVGSEPFYFYRGLAVGSAGSLEVLAEGGGCRIAVPDAFIEAPSNWAPFFFTPLVPQRVVEERLLLNDVGGTFIEFPIRRTGNYELTVRIVGTRTDPRYSPLWKGTVQSTPRTLSVRPARQESVVRWKNALERCLEGDCGRLEEATKFFSIVRDDEAADHLVQLLGKSVGVAHALAAQGRKRDVPALRAYAEAQVVPATREYYLDAVAKIERGDPCR